MHLTRTVLAAVLTFSTAASLPPPVAAAMPSAPLSAAPASGIETVQYRHDRRYRWHGSRHGWYHGHRGYRHHRHGYRRHADGWWYPMAAFGAGAVIGGAIANANRPVEAGINPHHYEWCSARYRTYRAYDNSYVPYVGAVAQCRSPYF